MKSDFTFFFKGTLKNMTAEKYDFDGNMNVNYWKQLIYQYELNEFKHEFYEIKLVKLVFKFE